VSDNEDGPPASGGPSITLSTLAGLGLANACSLAAGLALGHYLDGRLDTGPVFVLIGLAVGLVLGLVGSFLQIRRVLKS
jgi:F0F1-type ATP synthase assembly protein I